MVTEWSSNGLNYYIITLSNREIVVNFIIFVILFLALQIGLPARLNNIKTSHHCSGGKFAVIENDDNSWMGNGKIHVWKVNEEVKVSSKIYKHFVILLFFLLCFVITIFT